VLDVHRRLGGDRAVRLWDPFLHPRRHLRGGVTHVDLAALYPE
jgi:hypothetical protein